jgi:hypothetical protein
MVNTGVFASDHRCVCQLGTLSVHDTVLVGVHNSKFFGVLRAIEFNERGSVTAIEGGMVTTAELVELVREVFVVGTKSAECNREFSLLLLKVHQSFVERRNNMVKTSTEDGSVHFSFVTLSFVLSLFFHIKLFVFS